MKKTIFYCAVLVALAVSACSDDDEPARNDQGAQVDQGSVDRGTGDSGVDQRSSNDAGPDQDVGTATASGTIAPTSGNSITGTVLFEIVSGEVRITVSVANAPQGNHGIHLHETGDCSATDGTSTGGHWNPESNNHGQPLATDSHLGDLGNINVDASGNGTLQLTNPKWTLGDSANTDVVGRGLIVHADPDDFGQPTGNAGARIGCAEIALQN